MEVRIDARLIQAYLFVFPLGKEHVMNGSIWKYLSLVLAIALLLAVLSNTENTTAASLPAINPTPQPDEPGNLGLSSQGTEAQLLPFTGAQKDEQALLAVSPSASFYNIPGSVLIPVDGVVNLVYDNNGCVHATAGANYLLNAPLDIPPGSHIVLMRLYYDDTNVGAIDSWITRYDEAGTDHQDLVSVSSIGSAGHGSNYGDLDNIMDTYSWRYVINVRLNTASPTLQVCGIRVMYYAPTIFGNFLPEISK
jgi:hypothetical protein